MKYMKSFTLILLCSLLLTNSLEAGWEKRGAWEEWPRVKGAVAKQGDQTLDVFNDPRRPSDILIYPSCWLIRRDLKKAVSVNCPFKLIDDRLYFDTKWGYRPTGVEWGDPKIGGFSLFSFIFRRPRFRETSVSIWDGKEWIHVEGLPQLK